MTEISDRDIIILKEQVTQIVRANDEQNRTLDKIDQRFEALGVRLERLNSDYTEERVRNADKFARLDERNKDLEKKLKEQAEGFQSQLDLRFKTHDANDAKMENTRRWGVAQTIAAASTLATILSVLIAIFIK